MRTTNNISPRRPAISKRVVRSERHRLVIGKLVENSRNGTPQSLYAVMLDAGYSKATAIKPSQVTQSKGFQELLEEMMPEDELLSVHRSLLGSRKLDHMVFPLGPVNEDDPNFSGSQPNKKNPLDDLTHPVERTTLSDEEIKALIADVGGTVRRIVHGETARHVYFWSPNDMARHNALKLAYDLRGKLTSKEPVQPNNTYNTFIQQNNLDPNAPKSKDIIDTTLETLMEATKKRKVPA